MMNYRYTEKEYNIQRYIGNSNIIEEISILLRQKNIERDQLIDIINSLADFLQYNECYINMNSFKVLIDEVVSIIEYFNCNVIFEDEIIDKLILAVDNFSKELKKDSKIKLFFYGNDKYNILKKSLNKDIRVIDNINKYISLDKKDSDLQIKVLIVSEETIKTELEFGSCFSDVIYYDKLMNYIFNASEKIYYSNYDYNYLLKSLEKAKDKDIDTIAVGNSYPLTGIDIKLLKFKAVNLALSSQDLYYSYKLARLAISNNKNIKRCIIGAGYYLVSHDLSLSQNQDSVSRVKNVYYPILREKHNSEKVDEVKRIDIKTLLNDSVIDYVFNLEFLDNYFKDLVYRRDDSYFNLNFTREMNSILRGVKLSAISEEEKWRLGEFRANQHNKLAKYTETTKEYNYLFNEFIDFLNENNVQPVIVIFPNTKYYSKFLNKTYKEEFYSIINGIEERAKINIVDFSKENIFIEDDFIDFDHMSEIGARKITNELNRLLKNKE